MTENWPDVMVGIPAYNRPDTVRTTVEKLIINLTYEGNVKIVVSEDGDISKTKEALAGVIGNNSVGFYGIDACVNELVVVEGPGRGLGANLNRLLRYAQAGQPDEFIMNMDDDHWLEKPLDITPHVKHLMRDENAGWIRFYGIGHHEYVADLIGRYWYVRWDSPTLYIPSFRPHLKHIRFHDHFGDYPEGRSLGATEEGFCHQCKDIAKTKGGPKVLVPLMYDLDWSHGVGTESWQGKGM